MRNVLILVCVAGRLGHGQVIQLPNSIALRMQGSWRQLAGKMTACRLIGSFSFACKPSSVRQYGQSACPQVNVCCCLPEFPTPECLSVKVACMNLLALVGCPASKWIGMDCTTKWSLCACPKGRCRYTADFRTPGRGILVIAKMRHHVQEIRLVTCISQKRASLLFLGVLVLTAR